MRNITTVGIFGGTFNPVHNGHLRVAEEVRERIGLKEILFVPTGNPPLKSHDLAPAHDRYEMARIATEHNPSFSISDVESGRPGKSFTITTVQMLMERHPESVFYLILGTDAFLDIPAWYQPEALLRLVHVVILSRPGTPFSRLSPWVTAGAATLSDLDARRLDLHKTSLRTGRDCFMVNVTPLDISATAIRGLVRNNRSIKYLLPEAVESYIISKNLYKEGSDNP